MYLKLLLTAAERIISAIRADDAGARAPLRLRR